MNTQDLIAQLKTQIAALEAVSGEFSVIGFNVWSESQIPSVRFEDNTWSWGHCTSETCNHNSHDPYSEGGTQYVYCRPIIGGRPNLYILLDGGVFEYTHEGAGHYAPSASLRWVNFERGEK